MNFSKLKLFFIFLSLFLVFNTLAVVCISHDLPDSAVITPGETNGKWIPESYSWLVTSRETPLTPAMENASKSVSHPDSEQNYKAKVYLCGIVPIKTVDVAVVDNIYVTPGGESIGINLKTDGVLVVGVASFKTSGGKETSPAQDVGIRTGDVIKKINGIPVEKVRDLSKIINTSDRILGIEGIRDNREISFIVTPCTDESDGKKKIGLWVRETVAGIGTVSFYTDGKFAALGHPISDIDTGCEVATGGGTICNASIIGVDKGKKGSPGSLRGVFSGGSIGEIKKNSNCGVYGTISHTPDTEKVMLASKGEIHPGKAKLRCDIGNGEAENFDIEIVRITNSDDDTKSMMIKVTDKELLNKTGGIVQGMSGSPIVQDGKLVGAVTHVFVNDPTRGYGIFIENMLAEAEKIK